jgi:hypothetical protein
MKRFCSLRINQLASLTNICVGAHNLLFNNTQKRLKVLKRVQQGLVVSAAGIAWCPSSLACLPDVPV